MPAERDELVLLTSSGREFEAATIAEALHAHRIDAEVVHERRPSPPGNAAAVEHRVMVRASDVRKARDLLPFIQAQSMHLSWAQGSTDRSKASVSSSTGTRVAEPAGATSGGAAPNSAALTPAAGPAPAHPSHARGTDAFTGSRRVPLIIALVIIAAFVVVIVAIVGRPGGR